MKIRFFLAMILLFSILFIGCSDDDESITGHRVSFDSQGATTVASPTSKTVVPPETTIDSLPVAPVKTGYVFIEWRTAPYGGGTVFSASTTVSSNITIYATWTCDALTTMLYRELVSVTGTTDGTYSQDSDLNEDGDVADVNEKFTHDISSFKIGKYEVTYELWYFVSQWAQLPENGYSFSAAGQEGSYGIEGTVPAASGPVTFINWRDAIVWCNAYSQISGLAPVYYTDVAFTTVLKSATSSSSVNMVVGSEDNPYVNWSAAGFRLPTEGEWQYAATYKNGTSWTPFNYASGATVEHTNTSDVTPANGVVDGKDANDTVAVYKNYWNGTSWVATGVSKTANVGTKAANQIGIYDMSGNVFEWSWDWDGSYPVSAQTNYKGSTSGSFRTARGGSYNAWINTLAPNLVGFYSDNLQVGNRGYGIPWGGSDCVGFRVAGSN